MAPDASPSNDVVWMRRAADLAESSRPSPNPRVGSVVVLADELVGEGWHRAPGDHHAEVAAVRAAGSRARGSTVYVTLEPCNHHGRTPPCTEALIAAGVKRVVIGVRDPNPHVRGGGVERLREAGVDVTVGVESERCASLVHAWKVFVTRGTPYVVLKAAMSLDGRIATRTGESRWISSEASRADAHVLRAASDAIVVGIGTVLADDPALTVRGVPVDRPPARVVLDTSLRTPLDATLVRTADTVPTWIFHGAEAAAPERVTAMRARGVETFVVPVLHGRLDVRAVLDGLASRGIVQVLVEGGSGVHGSFVDARAADALVCYLAPMILGGRAAPPAFGGHGVAKLSEALRLGPLSVRSVGDDLKIMGEFVNVHGHHHLDR